MEELEETGAEPGGLRDLIAEAMEGEEELLEDSSPPLIDISSPPSYIGEAMSDSLILGLKTRVDHHRARMEYHRSKLHVWEAALKTALEEKGVTSASVKSTPSEGEGRANRAFVREVLKRNAKAGVTPKQIREDADRQELAYSDNFPYTILHKFRTQAKPEVREVGGRYFPVSPE
jgi:hypothetical protein